MSKQEDPLYIALLSVHGLIRGFNLELGRDADTGGQTLYVLELAQALGDEYEATISSTTNFKIVADIA